MVKTILVSADDGLYARVDTCLCTGCSFLNAHLWNSSFNSLGHTAELFYFLDVLPCLVYEFVGEGLNVVRTCPWVDMLADLCLVLDVDLSITCNTSREVCRESDSLVEGIGVERLCVTQYGSHGLDTSTAYIVEWILLGERPS